MQHLRDIECVWVWVWCENCGRSDFCYLHEWRRVCMMNMRNDIYRTFDNIFEWCSNSFISHFLSEKKGKASMSMSNGGLVFVFVPSHLRRRCCQLEFGMHKSTSESLIWQYSIIIIIIIVFECATDAFSYDSDNSEMAIRYPIRKWAIQKITNNNSNATFQNSSLSRWLL